MSVVKSECSDILSLGYKALFCFMQNLQIEVCGDMRGV